MLLLLCSSYAQIPHNHGLVSYLNIVNNTVVLKSMNNVWGALCPHLPYDSNLITETSLEKRTSIITTVSNTFLTLEYIVQHFNPFSSNILTILWLGSKYLDYNYLASKLPFHEFHIIQRLKNSVTNKSMKTKAFILFGNFHSFHLFLYMHYSNQNGYIIPLLHKTARYCPL